MVLHGTNLQTYAIHTVSPIHGNAWWIAFQNRLLAGYDYIILMQKANLPLIYENKKWRIYKL